MTRFRVYPYKQGSRSARALADTLGGRVLKFEDSRYAPRRNDVIINWGASAWPFLVGPLERYGVEGLNLPMNVQAAANKLTSFQRFREAGVSIPDFWTNPDDIPADRFPIVCRTVLNGHSGAGIVIADNPAALVRAPLYTAYVRKQDEFRVHVVAGRVIAVQRKALREGTENPDFRVRNLANGFIFARQGVEAPAAVLEQAISAVSALGLDFGGVDVLWNARRSTAYVLEVNTACGLEGRTVADYAEAFRALIPNR